MPRARGAVEQTVAKAEVTTELGTRRDQGRGRRAEGRRRVQRQVAVLAAATVLLGAGALAFSLRTGPTSGGATSPTSPQAPPAPGTTLPVGTFAALGVLPAGWSADIDCVEKVAGACARFSGTVDVGAGTGSAVAADEAVEALAAEARGAGYRIEGSQCLADASDQGRTCTFTATKPTSADAGGRVDLSALIRSDVSGSVTALLDAGL